MKIDLSKLVASMALSFPFGMCSAGQVDIGPVYLDVVAVVAIASSGHQAGNLEIHVKDAFTYPTGVTCTSPYITTLKSVDVDKRLLALLTTAQVSKQPVVLRVTDDPAYTAFAGRCSLVWVQIGQWGQ